MLLRVTQMKLIDPQNNGYKSHELKGGQPERGRKAIRVGGDRRK